MGLQQEIQQMQSQQQKLQNAMQQNVQEQFITKGRIEALESQVPSQD
jgi:hypothetical protein